MRKAFTLMEVNLALMVMAVGTLALVSLYTFGYRENRQSIEDVSATGVADSVLGSLTLMLASTNVTWSDWQKIPEKSPANGWEDYYDFENGKMRSVSGKAEAAYDAIKGQIGGSVDGGSAPGIDIPDGMTAGLVITRSGDLATIGFRLSKRPGELMSQPIFYTEVHFQGDPTK